MTLEELEAIILPYTTKDDGYGLYEYWFNIDEKRHPEKYGGATIPDIVYTITYDEIATAFDVCGEMFNRLKDLSVEQFQEAFKSELESQNRSKEQ
jgi:hypothetical protein